MATKLKTFFNRRFPYAFLLPLFLFIGYFALGIICYLIWPDEIFSNILLDGLVALLLGAWMLSYRKHRTIETKPLKFSIFGWGAFFMIFFLVYCLSEAVGNYIGRALPNALATESYASMEDWQLNVYYIMALTVGPIAEELLFRFGIFRLTRSKYSFWVAYLFSTVLFAASHMTLMHIPVAFMMSLFICIVYEHTGMFRYCLILHILFNFLAIAYLFSAEVPFWLVCGLYVLTFIGLILMYKFRVLLFEKIFKTGGMQQFENYLDEKRKHFGDKGYDDSDTKDE